MKNLKVVIEMKIAKILETTMDQPLAYIEKQLKSNFIGLGWEIEHTEDLRTVEGDKGDILPPPTLTLRGEGFLGRTNQR
ncbi:MAG: hypothetical protein ACOYVK_15305 [Bacillota bacterium]